MSAPVYYEQLQVGHRWRSPSRTVTETDVVNFATQTGDFNPLHVDHQFAQQSHFGKPIAHGLLGLSWVAGLGSNSPNVHTIAFVALREWNFLKPIHFGDTVHVLTEVLEKSSNGRRRGKVSWKRQLINQKGDVVQEGIFETLVSLNSAALAGKTVAAATDENAEAKTAD